MTVQPTFRPLRQAGIYALVIIASVALTLGFLRTFPQLSGLKQVRNLKVIII